MPMEANFWRRPSSFSTSAVSRWSRATMAGSVLAGAKMPNHTVTSTPLSLGCSAMLGTSGSAAERVPSVTPKAFTRPALTCWLVNGIGSMARSTWLPMRSVTICAPTLYGTCVICTPPIWLNISPATCSEVPMPEVA